MADLAKRFAALLALLAGIGLGRAHAGAGEPAYLADDPPPALLQAAASELSPAVPGTSAGPYSPPASSAAPRRAYVEDSSAAGPESVQAEAGEEYGDDGHDGHDGYLAPVLSSGEWYNHGCWFAEADFVMLARTNPKKEQLAVDTTSRLFDGLNRGGGLHVEEGDFRFSPGARLTLGELLGRDYANRDQSLELTFLGGFHWSTSSGVSSAGSDRLYTPMDPGFVFTEPPASIVVVRNAVFAGFNAADTQTFQYSSDMNSLELNLRSRYRLGRDQMVAQPDGTWMREMAPGPTPSLLIGLRYFRIDETFSWDSRRNGVAPTVFGGDYDVQTHNDLIGLQFGADWVRQEKEWRLGGWIKAGGYVNFAQQHSRVLAVNNQVPANGPTTPIDRDVSADEHAFTFAGEAGLTGAYVINPHVSLRGDLQMLWIQSVAIAPKQLTFDFAGSPSVDLSGNSFFMGAGVGVDVVW